MNEDFFRAGLVVERSLIPMYISSGALTSHLFGSVIIIKCASASDGWQTTRDLHLPKVTSQT